MAGSTAIETISTPLTLPGGCILPNRLVKCPMQETLARKSENFDPPASFDNVYGLWARAGFGLLITGQVQIDSRHLSTEADVCVRPESLQPQILAKWENWARVAQSCGTPCIVQLAHPGRMAALHYGTRQKGQPAMAPSEVKINLGDDFLSKTVIDRTFGTPKAMDVEEIETLISAFLHGTRVAHAAGFAGIQLHAAHGFLLSQYLNPLTNSRTDAYGGSTEGRLYILKRLITAIRAEFSAPFIVSVKLNSADFQDGALTEDESLEYVRYLTTCGQLDFVEISGGNAESTSSPLLSSINSRVELGQGVTTVRASTARREAYFTRFAERVKREIKPDIPIQLSGGFRSRLAMSEVLAENVCELIGLGRTVVINPTLPVDVLLNPDIKDEDAVSRDFQPGGLWIEKYVPKIIFGSLPIQFFYMNMQRLGLGKNADNELDIVKQVILQQFALLKSQIDSVRNQLVRYIFGDNVQRVKVA